MLARVRLHDTSNTVKDLIDDEVGDHRIADGRGSIWPDDVDSSCVVIRLAVEADDQAGAEREARRVVAGALLDAGQTAATSAILDVGPDRRP